MKECLAAIAGKKADRKKESSRFCSFWSSIMLDNSQSNAQYKHKKRMCIILPHFRKTKRREHNAHPKSKLTEFPSGYIIFKAALMKPIA